MRKIQIILLVLGVSSIVFGQQVGINTNNPDPSSILEIYAETKGVLVPRLTTDQRLMIPEPADGLTVFDITEQSYYFYSEGVWEALATESKLVWDKNQEGYIYNTQSGRVGIGTDNPEEALHIKQATGNPSIKLSNNDKSIIIVMDEGENDIFFRIDEEHADKALFGSTSDGKFGIGTSTPENILHLTSDINKPSIRLSSDLTDIEYIVGFDNSSSSFVIRKETLDGNHLDAFSLDESGNISLQATSIVDINPGISTPRIQVVHPGTGASGTIYADANGNIRTGTSVGTVEAIADIRFKEESIVNKNTYLTFNNDFSNSMFYENTSPVYSYDAGEGNYITIEEDGYYLVTYSIEIEKSNTRIVRFYTELTFNGSANPDTRIGNTYKNKGRHSLSYSKVLKLREGDSIKLRAAHGNYNGLNPIKVTDRSTITLLKVAD